MGNSSLIIALGTMLLFVVMNLNFNTAIVQQSGNAFDYYSDASCRNAANSVLAMLISRVFDDMSFRTQSPATLTAFGGQSVYTVTDTLTPDSSIKINVRTTIGGFTRSVEAVVSGWRMPPAFSYTAVSNGSFTLGGGAIIGAQDPTKNVLLHSNGNFTLSGSPTVVKGFVTQTGTFSGTVANVQPVSNPTSAPVVSSAPAVPIPPFNPDSYLPIATQIYNSSLTISSTISVGTVTNPGIIYVNGDLSISSGARISGFGIFLVKGNLYVGGGAQFINAVPGRSSFAFYTSGDVQVAGGAVVYGQILSQGSVSIGGNSSFSGTIAARGTISISGGSSMEVPVSEELIKPIWGSSGGSVRSRSIVYYE